MAQEEQAPKIQSAHAVMVLDGRYILQLRDNKQTIAAPGKWSLFGGRLRKGETPLRTIRREIYEELAIKPAEFSYLWSIDFYAPFEDAVIRAWFFAADVSAVWSSHRLREGKAARAFSFEELADLDMTGEMYETLERYHKSRGSAAP